jgi:murein DD-endopeptidase MepM/ murein hydrolase activator NlpD
LSRLARAAYQAGPLSTVESLLSATSPEDFQLRLSSLDRVASAQRGRIEVAVGVSRSYEARSAAAQAQRDALAGARQQAELALEEVARAEAEADAAVAALTAASAARRTALARAQAVARADEARYRQLVSEGERTRSALTGLGAAVPTRPGLLLRPVGGPVTSPYGMRVHPITGVYKLHTGTDFSAACGTPVRAAADGVVSSAAMQPAYGNRVVISHAPLGIATTYNHLSRFAVSSGAAVRRGEVIGWVGSTGYSTGCHLHFEVMAAGGYVEPASWL